MSFSQPFPLKLLSPARGDVLIQEENFLITQNHERYEIELGIAKLLNPLSMDSSLKNEIEVFENIPIAGIPYFRSILFDEAVQLVTQHLGNRAQQAVLVEIGGGEGYFARAFKNKHPEAIACTCDISMKHLQQAPSSLIKIQCDARKPYLAPETVDVAAFWVSLHHFPEADMKHALHQAKSILKPEGILLIFEPNADFLPRKILLSTPLKKLVYYDEEEQALSYSQIKSHLTPEGFDEIFATVHNPPYNWDFLKALRWSWLFAPVTETFFRLERILQNKKQNWWNTKNIKKSFFTGSYFLALLRKK